MAYGMVHLYSRKIILVTDHKPLSWIFSPKRAFQYWWLQGYRDVQFNCQPTNMKYGIGHRDKKLMKTYCHDCHLPMDDQLAIPGIFSLKEMGNCVILTSLEPCPSLPHRCSIPFRRIHVYKRLYIIVGPKKQTQSCMLKGRFFKNLPLKYAVCICSVEYEL